MPDAPTLAAPRAGRGAELRCRGWRQETLLRMLENVLEIAERPEELVVYAAHARAARDRESLDAIVAALRDMDAGETLAVQSGKPVGRFALGPRAPVVSAGQRQPRRPLGHAGALLRARGARADHLARADRGRVAVHRRPGRPAGHVRDLRGRRPRALRRLARRPARGHGRARGHGLGAAHGGRRDARRRAAVRRGRHRQAGATAAPAGWSTGWRRTSPRRSRGRSPRARPAGRCRSASASTPSSCSRRCLRPA